MPPEISPKSFENFEKQAPGAAPICSGYHDNYQENAAFSTPVANKRVSLEKSQQYLSGSESKTKTGFQPWPMR